MSTYTRGFFAMCFSATSATIVSGAVAERCSFRGYLAMCATVSAIIFPVVLHWQWGDDGWLAPVRSSGAALFKTGALDYAGSGFVHAVGGLCALIAIAIIGPREGRFPEGQREPNVMAQQSPVFQVVGGMIMWYGWYGFTCGSIKTLAGPHIASVCRVGLIHTIGGATGGFVTMVIDLWYHPNAFRPQRMVFGALCGLVSISASAAFIDTAFALLIGVVAGVIYVSTSWLMTHKWRLDDVVDAVPVHFFGGIWGIIAAALFSRKGYLQQVFGTNYQGCGALYGCELGGKVFAASIIYILSLCLWVACTFIPLVLLLKKFQILRVSEYEERVGMDAALHGGDSYPEFQTAIFNFKDKKTGVESKLEMRVRQNDAAKIAITLASLLETQVETGVPSA
ncbi:MAG: ammonium transporter [Burkholderiales bacterium]